MLTLTRRLQFLIEYLDLPAATNDPDATWELFQLEHLNDDAVFGITNKARQIGWSFLAAAEAVAEAQLEARSSHIFVSINHDEAAEKIRYARNVIEGLAWRVRPRLKVDNVFELEFMNGSRLISHPCRPVRGKARATVYLDEFAHYPRDREIYTSALPVTTKEGKIRIGSSPLGAAGMFWEIFDQKMRRYPGYVRRRVPWWRCAGMVDGGQSPGIAPTAMATEERVARFGNVRLKLIFENMVLEDFQQEYECASIDETVAWITWEEIKRNQLDAQEERLWFRQAKSVDEALAVIDEVREATTTGRVGPALAIGMDVGRKRDLTEIVMVEKTTTSETPYRAGISLSQVPFEDQKAVGLKALERLPVTQMLIDRNGIGMQLAEQIQAVHGVRAQGVTFTNASKELWAVELRVRMQKGQVPIPLDRELTYQVHSIKRLITAAKNVVFDTAANEKHHADKFWALALAVWAANRAEMMEAEYGENPVAGYRG